MSNMYPKDLTPIEDYTKFWDKETKCANKELSFNEAGIVEICLHADLELCDDAKPIIKRIFNKCKVDYDKSQELFDEAWQVDFQSIYNEKVRAIVEDEYGKWAKVDKYGALCYEYGYGWSCGDAYGQFPLFTDETLLRNELEGD